MSLPEQHPKFHNLNHIRHTEITLFHEYQAAIQALQEELELDQAQQDLDEPTPTLYISHAGGWNALTVAHLVPHDGTQIIINHMPHCAIPLGEEALAALDSFEQRWNDSPISLGSSHHLTLDPTIHFGQRMRDLHQSPLTAFRLILPVPN